MKLHTTEITAQRIKSFQQNPPRSPSFDFSNPNELEARYQAFCQEARSQLDTQYKPNLKHSTTFRNDKDEELRSMVRGAFKQLSEEKKRGIINPVVKTCGNLLIASVFEGLVLRAVEECTRGGGYGVKMNELDGGLSEKLMKSFGIDAFQLRSFRSYKEKRGYLIGVMSQTIDKLLKNWREKIETREKNSEFDDSKGEKTNEAFDMGFTFLQLKTKYEALRKKLTATVVQKLNDVRKFILFSMKIYIFIVFAKILIFFRNFKKFKKILNSMKTNSKSSLPLKCVKRSVVPFSQSITTSSK